MAALMLVSVPSFAPNNLCNVLPLLLLDVGSMTEAGEDERAGGFIDDDEEEKELD
jgi:hypothetical protein